MKNGRIRIVALAFASFTLFSFNTWAPTYLVKYADMSLVRASFIPSIIAFFMIGSNIYGGILLERFSQHVFVFILPPLLLAITWPFFLFSNHFILYVAAIVLVV